MFLRSLYLDSNSQTRTPLPVTMQGETNFYATGEIAPIAVAQNAE
nr:hypothetical protein IPBHJEJL_00086 [Klebsiella oxytoca]